MTWYMHLEKNRDADRCNAKQMEKKKKLGPGVSCIRVGTNICTGE
jgi:hypothetical protein